MKQGPYFSLKDHCTGCCFLKTTLTNDRFCDKLNMRLDTYNNTNLPIPNLNCPFAEENLIQFHNEALFKIHENKEEKIKTIIESIFSDFKFETLTINKILLSLEEVTDFQISQIQKELSQYNFKIERASDDINLILTLTKRK